MPERYAIEPADALQALTNAKNTFISLATIYVVGLGVAFAAWASFTGEQTRIQLLMLVLMFMVLCWAGAVQNLRLQATCHRFLITHCERDAEQTLINELAPMNLRDFTIAFGLLSAAILSAAWFMR